MAATLLASKTRVPRPRPTSVSRQRLTDLLRPSALPPLTVVAAPAGFGKTTLLAEWLATVPSHEAAVGWLSLDEGDNDRELFLSYVVSALQSATDVVGAGTTQQISAGGPSIDAALAGLVNDLESLTTHLVLVLDDYHLVTDPTVHDAVTFLLEHQPPELHLVLATRADPPLPLARMRARGELLEVRAADLRFTNDEAASYLNDSMGLALSADDVAALDGRTEGWIAALQLAALSMQGRADAGQFIAGFAGDDRYVVDYLAEEVLARQPEGVQDFLLETSVLERLSGPLCDAVTGRDDGTQTLVALDRANLFLVPLDDRRQWWRYHHLFADVLRAHLREQRPQDEAALHLRASGWFRAEGDMSQAVRHALAGGGHALASELMELAAPQMQRERREFELRRWLESLPEDVVAQRPVLAMTFVGTLAQVSDFGSVEERLSEIEHLLRNGDGSWPAAPPPGTVVVDMDRYASLPAMTDLYRAALALSRGDLDGSARHARAALAATPSGDGLTRAAAGALAGLASWATGDLAVAHAAYSESIDGLASVGFVADVLGCCVTLGDIEQTLGRLDDAVRTYQHGLGLASATEAAGPLRGTGDMHVGLAGVLLERGDLARAVEQLAASRRLGEHLWLPQNAYRSRIVAARLAEIEGDLDGALTLLDEADRLYDGDYSPDIRPVPSVRARLYLRRGELGRAEAWVAERQVSAEEPQSYLREHEHVTLARLLLARGSTDPAALRSAEALIERLLVAAEGGGRVGVVIELLIVHSLVRHAGRDVPAALEVLTRAVTLAEPAGYQRLFADEGQPMAALLTALAKRGTGVGYVRDLLAATTGARRPAARPGARLVDPLSDRELDVLRLLGSDLDGPDIARELSVSLNTMRTHTKNIYAKLGVTSRRAAVRQAQDLDLLPGQRRG